MNKLCVWIKDLISVRFANEIMKSKPMAFFEKWLHCSIWTTHRSQTSDLSANNNNKICILEIIAGNSDADVRAAVAFWKCQQDSDFFFFN